MLERIEGLYVIAQTPFSQSSEIDTNSIETLTDFYFRNGANGLTVLGISGEAGRLSFSESVQVADQFIRSANGRPVIVGVSNSSIAQLVELSNSVIDKGAAGVMITPASGLRTEEDVLSYFDSVIARTGNTSIVLQDYPAASGVAMSVQTICRLVEKHRQIKVIKHEDFPGLGKLAQLRNELGDRVSILTGSNGLYLPLELERGADGPMAGFSFPELLSNVYLLHKEGDRDGMLDLFDRYLPLLRYEAQGLFGIAARKEVLRRRGAIRSAAMRAPAPRLKDPDLNEIDRLLERLGGSAADLARAV